VQGIEEQDFLPLDLVGSFQLETDVAKFLVTIVGKLPAILDELKKLVVRKK
jgi:hypothetical protein